MAIRLFKVCPLKPCPTPLVQYRNDIISAKTKSYVE